MEDAPKLLKIPNSECPDIWIRLPRHKWPKSWSKLEDPFVLLERNLYGHPLAGLLWEWQFEKILLKYGWEKISYLGMLIHTPSKRLFLSVYVDDIQLAGKKQNIDPMWKVLNKEVELGEPTSFLDHVYLGCTQRQCEISEDIVDNYRTMFESRISAGGTEKLPFPQNLRISSWSYDMEGHAKKCVERYCEVANKTTQQLYKVSTSCIDDHHFKEEETKSVGELSNTRSQIVLKCLYLARIGRPDILWSVNKLARSITKWTKACDKRLSRLISYIHHTCEYKQYCHVGNIAKQCRLGLFQDSDFAGDLDDSKSTSGGTLCIFGSHTFVRLSWMFKKQTSVSDSSTESEIISLDAGLRLDGVPALDLCGQFYKVATPCIDDHQFKAEDMGSVAELSKVCSQIVLKCLYLARLGRPDILWFVNKLARAVTKWTRACDKRLARWVNSNNILSCEKHCATMQAGTVSGLWFCRRSLNTQNQPQEDCCAYSEVIHLHTQNQTKTPFRHDTLELCNVDYVSTNAKSSQFGAMLHFWGQRSSD